MKDSVPEVHVVLEQIEQELSKNNNLRAEIVNLNSTVQYEKRKNNFSQEKNDLLYSEIERKNSTIKIKNLTIQQNDIKATKKIEKQRVTYKEDRDNLLRYVIEQNEIANDLSKTILFMRAVISTSNSYLPSDTDTTTSFIPSSLVPIDEEISDDEECSVDTLEHDYRSALKTVISTGNKNTESEESEDRDDTIKSNEGDEGNSTKEQGEGENDGEGGEKDEAQIVGEENNNVESMNDREDKKGGEEKVEKKEEEKNVNAVDGVQNEEGKEESVTELVIEENKEELRSIMLRSKTYHPLHFPSTPLTDCLIAASIY